MSKVSIAAAAALVIASVAPVGAYAQSYGAFAQGYGGAYSMPEHQSRTQSKHLKARVPSNARASATESGGFPTPAVNSGGRRFETDPDPRIRFEMNRDDRDRRSGGWSSTSSVLLVEKSLSAQDGSGFSLLLKAHTAVCLSPRKLYHCRPAPQEES
jgi:hypothetical protein